MKQFHLKYNAIYETKNEALERKKGFEKYGWKVEVRPINHLVGIAPYKYGVYIKGKR